MIKAVLFDFRDTLVDVSKAREAQLEFIYNYVKKRGVNISFEVFREKSKEAGAAIIHTFPKNMYIHNWGMLINKNLLESLGVKVEGRDFEKLMNEMDVVFIANVSLYPDATTILNFLKMKDVKMGAVIDGTSKRERQIIAKLGLSNYLSVIVISEEVGKNKFSLLPLQKALEQLQCPAGEVMVVGDRIDKDIAPANKLGCIAIKLERTQGRFANMKPERSEDRPRHVISKLSELAEFF
ncbi:MAG: HAD family hydrolase [Candidatus Micrarchaeota archaeon]